MVTSSKNNINTELTDNRTANGSPDVEHRKPFTQVVQEWGRGITSNTSAKTNHLMKQQELNTSDQLVGEEANNNEETSEEDLEEWRREINQHASNEQEKLLFVCKKVTADDHHTSVLLAELLANNPQCNWSRIVDPQQSNCSLLHLLAQKNKVKCMEVLLSGETKMKAKVIDAADSISSTPLLYAVAHNAEDCVAYLLSKGGVNVNAKDIYNKFPLLLALRNKNYKLAEILLGHRNIDIHLRGTKGNTVLHTMVEEGDLTSTKFLVEKGASAQRRNNEEENVLFHSLPHIEIALYLAQHFSKNGLGKMLTNVNMYGQNIFHKVAADGFFDSLLVILGSLALGDLSANQVHSLLNTPDKNGDTPLILAVKAGRRDMIKFLCQCQETQLNDGDRLGNTALHYAAASKDQYVTAQLTKVGASFKASNSTDDHKDQSLSVRTLNRLKSLSTVLTFMLSIFAIVCIISVAVVCIAFFATNISSSASQIRKRAFGEVVDYLESSFDSLGIMQKTAVSQIADKVDVLDEKDAFRLTYTVYQANWKSEASLLASSSIRLFDGRSAGTAINSFTKDTTATVSYTSYTDPLIFGGWIFHNITFVDWKSFNLSKPVISAKKPIVWKWIEASANVTSTYWSEPYLKMPLTNLFYSLITPLRDPDTQKYLGYYALDATVQTINDYIGVKAREQYDSTIAILETRTQNLVATSNPNVTIYSTLAGSDGTDLTRYTGIGSRDARVAGMANYLRNKYGNGSLAAIQSSERIFDTWYLNGERQAINIARMTDSHGLDWIICQTLPTSVFFRTFGISIGVMAGLTIVLLVLGIILSTIAARLFMRPIFLLIQQAEDIKMLQLDKVEQELAKSTSYFTEVKSLQESYKSMTARLKQFRQFIPAHILSVIEAEIGLTKTGDKKKKDPHNSLVLDEDHQNSASDQISVSSGIYAKGMVNRALKSKLSSGCVSVMTIRFPDLEEILEQYSADDLSETTRDLFGATKKCVQESHGQLVNMTSKQCVIVWNSFISQSDHRLRACKTARQYTNEVLQLHKQWSQKHLPLLHISIGIASGVVYYGNVGSDSTKFFTIIGAAHKESEKLCSNNNHWGTQILISDDVYEHVRDEFYSRPVGNRFDDDVVMHELGEVKSSSEAWVDELSVGGKNNNPNDIWQAYREGYDLFHREQYPEALQVFTNCLQKNPYDIVCQKMIAECNEQSNLFSTNTRTEPDLISSDH